MTRSTAKIATCNELLDTFYAYLRTVHVEKLVFSGVGGRDVYNITAPFLHDGRKSSWEELRNGIVSSLKSSFYIPGGWRLGTPCTYSYV